MQYGLRVAFLTLSLAVASAAHVVYAQDRAAPDNPAPDEAAPSDQPDNLPAECRSLPEAKRRQTERCKTDEEKREDEYQKLLDERAEKEKPTHTSFLKWLHLDAMWVPTDAGASTYGLIGAHLAVANIKRVYFFGPPGVMLLAQKRETGTALVPALTWGVSWFLVDFRAPGLGPARLYVNLTKAWTMGDYRTGFDMAGLSVTWNK